MPEVTERKKSGYFLRLKDFQKIEEIIEAYHMNDQNEVMLESIPDDEKDILYKVKMIIHNIESARLRVNRDAIQ